MLNLSAKQIKRGIALFGGNFVLPFDNQIHLSNTLSKQYLEFCQRYNGSIKQDNLNESIKKQTISYSASNMSSPKNQNLNKKLLQKYEYLVLAPRKSEKDQQKFREFYDIGTIVTLQQCVETGGIKAVSKGVDSLVRIKKNANLLNYKLNSSYTQDNRLIVENDPTIRYNSVIKANELQYVIQDQRKLFFCDYETLHEKVPKYSDKEKERFIQSIHDLAQKTNYQILSKRKLLENIAFDQNNSMFPRVQLFQLLQHLDSKYYFNRSSSEWLDKKYEILKTKNDEQILESLQLASNQLNN